MDGRYEANPSSRYQRFYLDQSGLFRLPFVREFVHMGIIIEIGDKLNR